MRSTEQTSDLLAVWGADYHGTLDYVTGWHAKTLQYLAGTAAQWAFVTTNSVTQGESVAPLFRPILEQGWYIKFAHRTFRWTSEATSQAAVHCVIIGFAKTVRTARLFDYQQLNAYPVEIGKVGQITPYLTPYHGKGKPVLVTSSTKPLNPQLGEVSYGNKPTDGGGFIIEPAEYEDVIADPVAEKYVRRYVGARELLHDIPRYCLWLEDASRSDLKMSPVLRERVELVRQFRSASKAESTRGAAATAHLFRQISQPDTPYLCIPRHVSETRHYYISSRFPADVICSDANFLAPDVDGFSFSIISSAMFIAWQRAVGGRIKSDLRFNKLLTWNTFPLPHTNERARRDIVAAGKGVLAARQLQAGRSLAQLYEPGLMSSDLSEAHNALDTQVDTLFGISRSRSTELQRQDLLFERYRSMTE